MRRREEFSYVVRYGKRARKGSVVVHYLAPTRQSTCQPGTPARIGFVVGRQVGGSVERHRVIRQLRHATRNLLPEFPDGSLTVVRALPTASKRVWAGLSRDVAASLMLVKGDEK